MDVIKDSVTTTVTIPSYTEISRTISLTDIPRKNINVLCGSNLGGDFPSSRC